MSPTGRSLPSSCVVVVVDVQEKLTAAISKEHAADVERSAAILLEACAALGVPALATEQYPKGLGRTTPAIAERLAALGVTPIEKLSFSACDAEAFEAALAQTTAKTAVVIGLEAHVCVLQTVRDLRARGLDVLVPADGTASRRADHRAIGLDLCAATGATITTTETLVFDWLRAAGTEPFKRLSRLIR